MVPEDRDEALLLYIINALRDIQGFVEGAPCIFPLYLTSTTRVEA